MRVAWKCTALVVFFNKNSLVCTVGGGRNGCVGGQALPSHQFWGADYLQPLRWLLGWRSLSTFACRSAQRERAAAPGFWYQVEIQSKVIKGCLCVIQSTTSDYQQLLGNQLEQTKALVGRGELLLQYQTRQWLTALSQPRSCNSHFHSHVSTSTNSFSVKDYCSWLFSRVWYQGPTITTALCWGFPDLALAFLDDEGKSSSIMGTSSTWKNITLCEIHLVQQGHDST